MAMTSQVWHALCVSVLAFIATNTVSAMRKPFVVDYKSDPEPVVLDRKEAANFHKRRARRDLGEECYDEGCSREEVEESLGGGHALYQYYYGWRCMKLHGSQYTYSYNPHRLQCVNSLAGINTCASGISHLGTRTCYFGFPRNVYAVYMENGCNDGELGSFRLDFNDPSRSVRYIYNVGCREKKSISTVKGATSYTATLIGGGGSDSWISNSKLGWFGYNSKYCGNPGTPSHGYFSGRNYYETNQVTYGCSHGFVLVGNSKRTCQSYGWDGSLPSCKRICDAGSYSSTGYETCKPCPIGQYNPYKQRTSCYPCPHGKSTSLTGRRFHYECHYKCSKPVCTLQQWTQWVDSSTSFQSSCASRVRTRGYLTRWTQVLNPAGCDAVPKSCPSDQKERKEKDVYCDALTKPEFGYYLPAGCTTNKQLCKSSSSSTCVFHCNDGFQRVGQDSDIRRVCQSNGQWSYSGAKCKDIKAPVITCPSDVVKGNDQGKPFARITLPIATATDNSGKAPSIQLTTPGVQATQDFPISDNPMKIEYKAVDGAGLSDSCRFYVHVKDVEKPSVTYCPEDYSVFTKERPKNIMFKEPKFKDNYDAFPVIKKSHTPGQQFHWNTYKIVYNATDNSGNMESCSFNLQVGPLKCKFYDAPDNGVRACNIHFSGVKQEFMCDVQCRENYDFVAEPLYHSYNCKEDGIWYGYKMFNFIPLTMKPGEKPWPDCSLKSPPTGVTKKAKIYAGTCLSGNAETQRKIKENFIKTLKDDFFMNSMICSNGVDCKLDNVKVYCGKNSKRRKRGFDSFVIEFDLDLLDLNPSHKEPEQRLRLKSFADKIQQNKQKLEASMKSAAAIAFKVVPSSVDIEDDKNITGACAAGKVVRVKNGVSSSLDRTECVGCSTGTFYDEPTKLCIPCRKGTFQDREGQKKCQPCPVNTDSLGDGAKNIHDCKPYCSKGEYSTSGLASCTSCRIGEYQPNTRSKRCIKCPSGTSTLNVKTFFKEDCKKFCSAGYFSDQGGLGACVPCPRGSYQPNAKGTSCTKCPSGMTTVNDGASSSTDCKQGKCAMDFENGINHWTKTGTAFNNQPTCDDNPRHRNRESAQHQGNWWIGGYENRPQAAMPAGNVQGDGPQGTLTSPMFLISGNEISFLIGGGCDINVVRVELVIDNNVVRKETGKCFESMVRKYWSVKEFKGKMAQVRLVDASSNGWGHINFDDLRGDACI